MPKGERHLDPRPEPLPDDDQAVDEWLAELGAQNGPIEPETLEWAARIVDGWEAIGDQPP